MRQVQQRGGRPTNSKVHVTRSTSNAHQRLAKNSQRYMRVSRCRMRPSLAFSCVANASTSKGRFPSGKSAMGAKASVSAFNRMLRLFRIMQAALRPAGKCMELHEVADVYSVPCIAVDHKASLFLLSLSLQRRHVVVQQSMCNQPLSMHSLHVRRQRQHTPAASHTP